jgi:hypothetical protein
MNNTGIKGFVVRGLAAGATGGVTTALFIRFVTESQIGNALGFEDAKGIGAAPGDPAEFSRSTQHWGGMVAAVIYGLALGLVLGVACAALHHRLTGRNEFQRAIKVAAAGFVGLVFIPALKYPPNPPTVGNPDTIGQRSSEYLLLMMAAIVVVFLAWTFWVWLTERGWDGAPRFLVAGGAFVAAVALLVTLWPASPDPINPPENEAVPALEVSPSAPPEVLAAMLADARATGDEWLRDPQDPSKPLPLAGVSDPAQLVGVPAAVNTSKLVPNSYTNVIWHFRMLSIGGLALLWAVIGGVFGLLADAPVSVLARRRRTSRVTAPPG